MSDVVTVFSALAAATMAVVSGVNEPNIIVMMLDDFGRADWSAGMGQWGTPNLDAFKEDSIFLSHHYIGYVCSASRSQFLTGRYAFNSGYGTLDVFTNGKVGGIPLGTPTIADYLKRYSNYKTYALGKWQLGLAFKEQTPTYRGFDYFYGFYGGLQDYYDKTAPLFASGSPPSDTYPDYIANDENEYLDFWENEDSTTESQGTLSTQQYFDKMKELIARHANDNVKDPFFVYNAFQAAHGPFPTLRGDDEWLQARCEEMFNTDNEVCQVETDFDDHFGQFLDWMQSDDLKSVWENTIIMFTTDNGADLESSCNYPLRGGKNTYFEGSQRVVTMLGGGYIPQERRGVTLSGLVSNVDWAPTILSFAGLVPADYTQISLLNDEDSDIPLTLDGYNLYQYLMVPGSEPVRDHVMFQVVPQLNDLNNEEYLVQYDELLQKKVGSVEEMKLSELGLIFFDDDGTLWKYLDTLQSTNELGDVSTNTQWCDLSQDYLNGRSQEMFTKVDQINGGDAYREEDAFNALYDLTRDERESRNLLGKVSDETQSNLEAIIIEKTLQYFDKNQVASSMYLYGNFDCFYENLMDVAWPGYFNGVFAPFMDQKEFDTYLQGSCGFSKDHIIYKLHTQDFSFETIPDLMDDAIIDETDVQKQRNLRATEVDDGVERMKDEMGHRAEPPRVEQELEQLQEPQHREEMEMQEEAKQGQEEMHFEEIGQIGKLPDARDDMEKQEKEGAETQERQEKEERLEGQERQDREEKKVEDKIEPREGLEHEMDKEVIVKTKHGNAVEVSSLGSSVLLLSVLGVIGVMALIGFVWYKWGRHEKEEEEDDMPEARISFRRSTAGYGAV